MTRYVLLLAVLATPVAKAAGLPVVEAHSTQVQTPKPPQESEPVMVPWLSVQQAQNFCLIEIDDRKP